MADKKSAKIKDLEDSYKEINKLYEELLGFQKEELNGFSKIFDVSNKLKNAHIDRNTQQQKLNNMLMAYETFMENGYNISKKTNEAFKKRVDTQKQSVKLAERNLLLQKTISDTVTTSFKAMGNQIKGFWKFLMEADGSIKDVTKELGFSGERSDMLRQNIYDSATYAAKLGSNVKELSQITSIYADETGRARVMTEEANKAILEIAKGTGLGIEGATRLAGQYELMGLNAVSVNQQVQNIVDTSERMGVNTTKVLKKISTNFKQLQRFNFKQGVNGFAEMASYSEKFKVDMGQMLDSAERARTLEGAIEMASKLQVLGGKFADSDPLQMLHLSRNDPAEWQKFINNMTKGVASIRKGSDGMYQNFISPMDLDRLKVAEQTLGLQNGELTEQARRMADIQKMRQQMIGSMFSKEQKEAIEGMAQFDSNSGKFMVQIGSASKNLSQLTKEDANLLVTQSKSLEARAKDSQTFEQVWMNTLNEFKSVLLPVLDGVNWALSGLRKIMDYFKSSGAKFAAVAATLLTATFLLKGTGNIISNLLGKLPIPKLLKAGATSGGGAINPVGTATKGAGMSALGKGAGIGIAAVGAGAGIKLAADGISNLAAAMKDLDSTQIWGLAGVIGAIGIASIPMAIGITAIGKSAEVSIVGLLALGAAAVGVGYGINLATSGVGKMAEGFSTLENVDMVNIGLGMGAIAASTLAFSNPLGMLGMGVVTSNVVAMSKAGSGIEKVSSAFQNIGAVMNGSLSQLSDVKDTIDSINSIELGKNSALSSLSDMFSRPLKVEFADKNVTLNADMHLNVDGREIANKTAQYTLKIKEGKA